MNHFVPDFELHEECSVPTPSPTIAKLKNRSIEEEKDEMMQLLWHQQSFHKSPPSETPPPPLLPPSEPTAETSTQLYIEEDEMATWLHYPFEDLCNDDDDTNDIIYSTPPPPPTPITPPPPPPPVTRPPVAVGPQPAPRNFQMFSRLGGNNRTVHEPEMNETTSIGGSESGAPSVEVAPPIGSSVCGGAKVDRKRKGREMEESVTTGSESQREVMVVNAR